MDNVPITEILVFLVLVPLVLVILERYLKDTIAPWKPQKHGPKMYGCYGKNPCDGVKVCRTNGLRDYVSRYLRDQVTIWYVPFPITIFFYLSQKVRSFENWYLLITVLITLISIVLSALLRRMRQDYDEAFELDYISIQYIMENDIRVKATVPEIPEGGPSWLTQNSILFLRLIKIYTFGTAIAAVFILVGEKIDVNILVILSIGAVLSIIIYFIYYSKQKF